MSELDSKLEPQRSAPGRATASLKQLQARGAFYGVDVMVVRSMGRFERWKLVDGTRDVYELQEKK